MFQYIVNHPQPQFIKFHPTFIEEKFNNSQHGSGITSQRTLGSINVDCSDKDTDEISNSSTSSCDLQLPLNSDTRQSILKENSPRVSSDFQTSFKKGGYFVDESTCNLTKDSLNKALELTEISICDCNSEITKINKIKGYEKIRLELLLECTQKLDSLRNHAEIINSHIDKITEIEKIDEGSQQTIFRILNIAKIMEKEKGTVWLISHNWKELLTDPITKELIEDKINNEGQKSQVGAALILKY